MPLLRAATIAVVAIILASLGLASCGSSLAAGSDVAVINGAALTDSQLEGFRTLYGVTPGPGRYWYDARSGIWGMEGAGAAGFLLPGLALGAVDEGASRGSSGVVVNGRRLPEAEVDGWSSLIGRDLLRGRYWLDHLGNFGVEGSPMATGNLLVLASQRARARTGGGGGGIWSTRFSAGNHDPVSGAGYVSVPGYGPVGHGM